MELLPGRALAVVFTRDKDYNAQGLTNNSIKGRGYTVTLSFTCVQSYILFQHLLGWASRYFIKPSVVNISMSYKLTTK